MIWFFHPSTDSEWKMQTSEINVYTSMYREWFVKFLSSIVKGWRKSSSDRTTKKVPAKVTKVIKQQWHIIEIRCQKLMLRYVTHDYTLMRCLTDVNCHVFFLAWSNSSCWMPWYTSSKHSSEGQQCCRHTNMKLSYVFTWYLSVKVVMAIVHN